PHRALDRLRLAGEHRRHDSANREPVGLHLISPSPHIHLRRLRDVCRRGWCDRLTTHPAVRHRAVPLAGCSCRRAATSYGEATYGDTPPGPAAPSVAVARSSGTGPREPRRRPGSRTAGRGRCLAAVADQRLRCVAALPDDLVLGQPRRTAVTLPLIGAPSGAGGVTRGGARGASALPGGALAGRTRGRGVPGTAAGRR